MGKFGASEMFFIAGTKGETSTVATGEFYCPECNAQTSYNHDQVHEKITVFFIPIANLNLLGEYIECQNCFNTYKMEILDYNPEEEEQEFEALYLIGLKKVMTMMMLADGKIEESEKAMMKDIYQHVADAELSNEEIDNEINSCKENPIDLEVYLAELFPQLNESGRETIVKLAYWVSISDGHFDKEEEKLLKKLAKHFQISNAHLKGIILEVNETLSG